ncbi:HNH endonuclease [Polyangium mundeleinium]|uniref:HNH endonuclease n=1 Tax=Polyangium mundeleinium TaxID=2995306 RepID=A0ABT5EK27_9BACT|nr:HNH endonuclease [Polyangium mundeleinium]MDC0742156.1 HNH endonuclease [Polyangium mundeleinium]
MQRGIRGYVALLVALSLVLFGCASSRDPIMARIFEAPNVIHVCVRPPNVPKDKGMWALDASGAPVFGAREVDFARRAGLGVYIFDQGAPRESAKLLPIPYHRLECPAPPKPRVAAAKIEAGKKEESKKAERPKPLLRPIPRETSAVERRVEAQRCTAYEEPGQTRRRSGSGGRTCTRVLVQRARTEPVVAESPREVEPPASVRLSEGAAREYEDWGLTPADVSALAEERGRECLERICHARHQNFIPKGKKKPAEGHNGQSLSTGSGGGGGAKTTVKTTTRPHNVKGQSDHQAVTPKEATRGSQPASRPGQPFTKAGKEEVWNRNAAKHGGKNKCDTCLVEVAKPQRHTRGVTPPANEGHVDHKAARANGGSGTPENGQVLCRDCNAKKRDK